MPSAQDINQGRFHHCYFAVAKLLKRCCYPLICIFLLITYESTPPKEKSQLIIVEDKKLIFTEI